MNRLPRPRAVLLVLLICIGSLSAVGVQAQMEIERVRQSLEVLLPGLTPDSIRPTPVEGLYEVVVGSRLVYVTGDGRYMIEGEITDLEQQKNLTVPRLNQVTVAAIDAIGEQQMLIFEADDETRHTLSVFTDIDSAYSRKLQREIRDYTRRGIRVRYLFFPRAGNDSISYDKAVAVWCAPDRRQALERAMAGEVVESSPCENPVARHLELARRLGVSGAPVLVLDNGDMLPGYVSAERLLEVLDRMESLQQVE
ncbi:MAG: DsbC family protein [Sedimenticola sp.]|nr:DsbC family protein [Sedimenticola sp.]